MLIAIEPLHPLIQEVAAGSFRQKQPPAIKGSGWVVQSLEASLWAFHDADYGAAVLVSADGVRRAGGLDIETSRMERGLVAVAASGSSARTAATARVDWKTPITRTIPTT